jgi:cytosine/creatinine deaminase
MTTIPDVPSRFAATTDLVLSRAITASGERVDVLLRDGRVATVTPAGTEQFDTAIARVDLKGYVLLAAPAEPHAHLDKALTWESLATGPVDLPGAIDAWTRASRHLDRIETQDRALRAITEMVSHGVTAVRTHADVCPGDHPLAAVEALAGLRDATAGVVDLQIALLSRASTPDDVIRGAVDAGADLVGGAPYMEADPAAENARLLRLASELSVGVDLHVDEELDASVASLGDLARRVVDLDFPFDVTASHCVSLGIQDPALIADTIAAMVAAGLRVVTLPLTNLYLMGRDWETSPPRGLTAIRRLLNAGVTTAAGGDNLRDPFNPLGRADPLAIASLLVTAGHVTVTEAYDAVSVNSREVLGLPPAGVAPGLVADLLAVRAVSLDDAVARTPDDRIVIRAGRVIATSETTRRTALDPPR